jgi:uroporphyrinogen decarboxylase
MNSKERLLAALRHQPVDRVPANITYYMAAFRRLHFPSEPEQDPFEEALATHTRFGFDPLIGLGGGAGRPWQQNDPGRWTSRQERGSNGDGDLITYIIETPAGELSTTYNAPAGMSGWQMAPLIKEERDLDALAYLPAPSIDVEGINARWEQLGERGLGMVSINGIWQEACYLRGMEEMAMDPYLRPEWARAFLGRLADHLALQAEALCRSKVETFFINESYVGMGLSPKVFDEFVRPYDERFVRVAKDAGKLVLYHDCGLANALLESFAQMGIDYLEPLNPKAASGDVDPADAKRRIGAQVCIRGGFNHELLTWGSPEDVRREATYCLETLAPGGGYILCPAGPLDADVRMENLVAFAEAAQELGGQYGNL